MATRDIGSRDPAPAWFTRSADDVLDAVRSRADEGLASDEAARRLVAHGPNELAEAQRRGPARMLLAQLADTMVLLLVAAAVVAGLLGEAGDSAAIVAIVVLNAVLGFVQEYRAERAMAALRAMSAAAARVRRDGRSVTVPAASLVPGDVVLLEAGNLVPADLRVLDAPQLTVDESALTGESQPVTKTVGPLEHAGLPLGDRRNMAYKGTMVTYGRGVGVVVATGMRTELGRIAALLAGAAEPKTPLQKRLARFGRGMAVAVLALCAIIFAAGLLRGEPPVLMFMTALSLAVAAVPEALPAMVTVSLALGARKLVRQHALVRRLPAVETLGSVTYVCSDKTGTLTENRMRVELLQVGGRACADVPPPASRGDAWRLTLEALALSNDADADPDGVPVGDPTEVALHHAASDAGVVKEALAARLPRIGEIPFSSERARMTTVHRRGDGFVAYTKGAPERVLAGCVDRLGDAGVEALDHAAVHTDAARMAASGLRVLALAVRRLSALPADLADVERGQTFLGLVGLLDPPRATAHESVALCQSAGIRVVMITGDHPATARAIAWRLGILTDQDRVLAGPELAAMRDEDLAACVAEVRVYARVAPEDKLRIVRALQARGEYVAMTGDGVNDAPALRRADIGVAMGRTGTDVAREAAHMVLLDDDFATIVNAVREGRRIYDDVRKFVRYILSTNSGEIWTLFLAPFLGLPLPLLPIHILWMNLVTDGLPGLALVAEPPERDVMRRPPRPPTESIFAHGLWQHAVWVGLLMAGVTLGVQAWAYHTGDAHWQSMTFTVLTLSQLGHVLAIRSERESLVRLGLWSNRPLLGAVALTFVLQLATLYVPALSTTFRTTPLTAAELAGCPAAASVVLLAVEVEKWLRRRGEARRAPRD